MPNSSSLAFQLRLIVLTVVVLTAASAAAQPTMFDGAADPDGVRAFLQTFNPDPEKRREIQSFIEQLDSARYATRSTALRELSSIPLIPTTMLRSAETDPSAEVRAALAYLRTVHSAEFNDLRLRHALAHIERHKLSGSAELILIAVPNAITHETKSTATKALRVTATPRDAARLIALLDDPAPYMRRTAAIALAASSGKTAVSAISKLLQDPNTLVRLAAAEALLNLDERESLPVLVELLRAGQLLPRWRSVSLLRGATGQDFNYSAIAAERARLTAADHWEKWVRDHADDHPLNLPAEAAGYIPLFNGSDLSGFESLDAQGNKVTDHWKVAKGILSCRQGTHGYLRTHDIFSQYRLTLEWRSQSAAGDSGIGIVVAPNADHAPTYLEVQLHTANAGDLYRIGKAQATVNGQPLAFRATKRHESNERYQQWNSLEIIVRNKTVSVYVNGLLQNEATVEADAGHIALRNESSVMEFRDVRLIPLEDESILNVDPRGE